jgi:hypothetical protein
MPVFADNFKNSETTFEDGCKVVLPAANLHWIIHTHISDSSQNYLNVNMSEMESLSVVAF